VVVVVVDVVASVVEVVAVVIVSHEEEEANNVLSLGLAPKYSMTAAMIPANKLVGSVMDDDDDDDDDLVFDVCCDGKQPPIQAICAKVILQAAENMQ
jgi:hypothetical protein